jgi:hypothetical protein
VNRPDLFLDIPNTGEWLQKAFHFAGDEGLFWRIFTKGKSVQKYHKEKAEANRREASMGIGLTTMSPMAVC